MSAAYKAETAPEKQKREEEFRASQTVRK